ncbi:MAG: hypothetical protein HYV26_10185 [Candidatus Hydrogenedentes bacterium]|nr:hypothetical protein [Candidatus Hydrogenedentota bacterium]
MKHYKRGIIIAGVVTLGVVGFAFATVLTGDYLEITTGGITIGGTGNAGANKLLFANDGSYIRITDAGGEDDMLHILGDDHIRLYSNRGVYQASAIVMAGGSGAAKMIGRDLNNANYQGTAQVAADEYGSSYLAGVPAADDETYAVVEANKDGYAYMASKAQASVECTVDGDVVIQLGVSGGEGMDAMGAMGEAAQELPSGMQTPHHEIIEYLAE